MSTDAAGTGLARGFAAGHPALVVYLMAGFPDRAASLVALEAVADAGADVIELGVPYADPLADGPVIVEAAKTARAVAEANGSAFGLAETIELAGAFISARAERGCPTPPIALMTYYNPMLRAGLPKVAAASREAGVSGFIVPDMPPEAAKPWLAASAGLDTVFLVAPTSTPERLATVGAASRGFVYCVSTTGVTGERAELPEHLSALVERVKAATSLPVAVGFGVSTPAQAVSVARGADGVVVGSACVRRQADASELGAFVAELAAAVHTARG